MVLRPFFAALAALDGHRARRPLRIVQIGDSHTANDAFSGRLRERLQARFGGAGRGWLPAGIPFAYFRPELVTVAESGWKHLRPGAPEGGALFGLDGAAARAAKPGARMTLTSTEPEGFDRIAIEYVAGPHGTPLILRLDNGAAQRIATEARGIAVRRFEKLLARPAHEAELSVAPLPVGSAGSPHPNPPPQAGEGIAQVLGWAVERRRGGIVYENHGTIGATVGLLEQLTPAAVGFELAERRPGLLVVAFGTNEGFRETLEAGQYGARFRAAVAELRKRAKGAAVLILGPPDGNRRSFSCAGQGEAAACSSGAGEGACAWSEPRHLAAVRDIQRRVAREQGWAFWDWSAAMGGNCSIDRWLRQEPPLAMADHVHLNKAGYTATADMLFAALMREYEAWRRGRSTRR